MKNEPKIILFDLETLPDMDKAMRKFSSLSNYPGLSMKASINSIICFGYKLYGEKETKVISSWDFKSGKKNINNDYELVKKIYEILKDADCVVTHNGKRFDLKFLQTRLAIHNLPMLPKILHVDTCQIMKSHMLMFNNRLGTITEEFFNDKKLENGGWDLWYRVYKGDKKAMRLMRKYCAKDVILLAKLFKKLLPVISTIPNYNMFGRHDKLLCPKCGSSRVTKNGNFVTKEGIRKRLMCRDCLSYSTITSNGRPKS